ncbi:hypothetical protein DPMN_096559 [Dreissena polymorpha]|uniref:Uncharacterized protein n=1 Tax=Dreissena polymorpha TaxID=45954 RepID=A0A9D4L9L9_DREPO|nr:hypothetical protein DPMN_096559 [Dreissena polymorpha]
MRSDLFALRSPYERSTFQEKSWFRRSSLRVGVRASRRNTEEEEYRELGGVHRLQP